MSRLLIALLVTLPSLAQAKPIRGPYVQMVTPSSAVVVWRTTEVGGAALRYSNALDGTFATVESTSTSTQHEVRIDDLVPNTKYFYAVDAETADEDHHFITAPEPGTAFPFKLWLVGDSGVATAKQARVRDAMLRENGGEPPDVYLHVGDMAYSDGTDQELQERYFEMYQNILRNTVAYPAIGNHEGGASDSLTATGPYYDAYVLPTAGEVGGLSSGTEAYYSWDWGNVHFIVLESHRAELREVDGAMLQWLEMDLAATDQRWITVYFHHPPYTKGSHDSDTEISHIDIRERAMPIFDAAGVDLVLGGHSHIYERSYLVFGAYDTPTTAAGHIVDDGDGKDNRPYEKLGAGAIDGAICIVAGHGGTNVGRDSTEDHPLMFKTELVNGSVIIDVEGDVLRIKNVRMDGVVSDALSITKDDALRLTSPEPGATLVVGSTVAIDWISTARISSIDLEYSADGEAWTPIATAPAAPGRYVWTVPAVGDQVFVRGADAGSTGARDQIDGPLVVVPLEPVRLIGFESQWRYFAESLDGQDWTSPDFRDTPWTRGQGPFAVCACLPWECACNSYVIEALLTPTLYLRKRFEVPSADFRTLDISVVHEVGARIFINGTRVYGRFIDDESFDAFADPLAVAAEIQRFSVDLTEQPVLVEGQNTIAVLLKKNETVGPSLFFDLEMHAIGAPPVEDDGCGCAAARPSTSAWVLLVFLPLLVRCRRTHRAESVNRSSR